MMANLSAHLAFLYGADEVPAIDPTRGKTIAEYQDQIPVHENKLTEQDSLILARIKSRPRTKNHCKLFVRSVKNIWAA